MTTVAQIGSTTSKCSINGPSSIEENQSVTYSITSANGSSYFWSVTGGLSIVGSNSSSSVQVQGTNEGTGKVCVTRFKNGQVPCCTCNTVAIEPPCVEPDSITWIQDISIPYCMGDILEFNAILLPSDAPGTYSWSITNNYNTTQIIGPTNTSNLKVQSSPIPGDGLVVNLTFTSSCPSGKVVTYSDFARYNESPGECPPARSNITKYYLSPNPSRNFLNISTLGKDDNYENTVEIFSSSGESVLKSNDLENINVSELKKGIYFIQIISDQKVIETLKWIKE
ncbi:hypothetical protein GCM10009117_25950 [Gangjinia marincola]|uniref:Secretion system C-terminal sorting domain-containing protein n=2 Tax=Gangjinia marincola TaxID=578463 RepID=A0ABN1MKK6_9FLAO